MPERRDIPLQKRDYLNRTIVDALKKIESEVVVDPNTSSETPVLLQQISQLFTSSRPAKEGADPILRMVEALPNSQLGLLACIDPYRTKSSIHRLEQYCDYVDKHGDNARVYSLYVMEIWRMSAEEMFRQREHHIFETSGRRQTYRKKTEMLAYFSLLFAIWDKVLWKEIYSDNWKSIRLPGIPIHNPVEIEIPQDFSRSNIFFF